MFCLQLFCLLILLLIQTRILNIYVNEVYNIQWKFVQFLESLVSLEKWVTAESKSAPKKKKILKITSELVMSYFWRILMYIATIDRLDLLEDCFLAKMNLCVHVCVRFLKLYFCVIPNNVYCFVTIYKNSSIKNFFCEQGIFNWAIYHIRQGVSCL